jgi:hypothetical protein
MRCPDRPSCACTARRRAIRCSRSRSCGRSNAKESLAWTSRCRFRTMSASSFEHECRRSPTARDRFSSPPRRHPGRRPISCCVRSAAMWRMTSHGPSVRGSSSAEAPQSRSRTRSTRMRFSRRRRRPSCGRLIDASQNWPRRAKRERAIVRSEVSRRTRKPRSVRIERHMKRCSARHLPRLPSSSSSRLRSVTRTVPRGPSECSIARTFCTAPTSHAARSRASRTSTTGVAGLPRSRRVREGWSWSSCYSWTVRPPPSSVGSGCSARTFRSRRGHVFWRI